MYQTEPWGDDWQQAAGIMSMVSYGPLKKPLKAEDFIPGAKARRARQTPSQMLAVFKQAAAQLNAAAKAKAVK